MIQYPSTRGNSRPNNLPALQKDHNTRSHSIRAARIAACHQAIWAYHGIGNGFNIRWVFEKAVSFENVAVSLIFQISASSGPHCSQYHDVDAMTSIALATPLGRTMEFTPTSHNLLQVFATTNDNLQFTRLSDAPQGLKSCALNNSACAVLLRFYEYHVVVRCKWKSI